MRRDDRRELLAGARDAEALATKGTEKTRLAAQLQELEAMRNDERLEDYEEAGARLKIPGPITPAVIEARGIVRGRLPKEPEEVRKEPTLPAVPPDVP